uniref:Uncharacterized protein n=1 Tax=Pelusios castaneus TaxID=367368 RepID=A0A8C8REM7_9SAUR
VVTWLAVVVLNVDVGLAVGVVFSMMTVICRTQRYRGAAPQSQGPAGLLETSHALCPQCLEIPGVTIVAYHAPIYYGNRDFFREALSRRLGLSQPGTAPPDKGPVGGVGGGGPWAKFWG